eukprot:8022417-Pyramimonas_sp.AAC.1
MSKFEDLVDAPTPEGAAREASEAEPEHDDGRLSTIYEESEADLESHAMEVWHAELRGKGVVGGNSTRRPLYRAHTRWFLIRVR